MPKRGINVSDQMQNQNIVMGGGTVSSQVDYDNLQGQRSYGFTEAIRTTSRAGDLLTLEQIARYAESRRDPRLHWTILEWFWGTGIDRNTSKDHEEDALADVLMTMSQIPVPDVTLELAEVGAIISVFDALRRESGR